MGKEEVSAQEMFDGMIVAKFRVERVETFAWPGNVAVSTPVLNAVIGGNTAEDQNFSDATPWGELKLAVSNPVALIKLQPGREFLLTLSPIAKVVTPTETPSLKNVAADEYCA